MAWSFADTRYALCIAAMVLIAAYAPLSHAATDETDLSIPLGQSVHIEIDGTSPFAANEQIVVVKETSPGNATVTGLSGGSTDILFWKSGALHSQRLTVVLPERLQVASTGPQIKGGKPYFIYGYQNSSTYTHTQFYRSPSHNHSLSLQTPIFGGFLQTATNYRKTANGPHEITNGQVRFQNARTRLLLGNTSASLARIATDGQAGASFFGSTLLIHNIPQRDKFNRELMLFGGIEQPENLTQLQQTAPLYGGRFTMSRTRQFSLTPDMYSGSFARYQLKDQDQYGYAGAIESRFHIGPRLAFGVGGAKAHGGISGAIEPLWERTHGLTRARYSYASHDLERYQSDPATNDQHAYRIDNHQSFNDGLTVFRSNFTHLIADQQGNSDIASSNAFSLQNSLVHQKSFQNSMGVTYSLARSQSATATSLANSLGLSYSHVLNPHSYMSHTLAYARTDLSGQSNQIAAASRLTTENTKYRSDLSLTSLVSRGDSNTESLSLQERLERHFKKGHISLGAVYTKNDFSSQAHLFTLSTQLLYYLTSVHALSFNTSSSIVAQPRETQLSGFISINYQHYFGPGVERDSIFRTLFRGGKKSRIHGDIFFDHNFNSTLDAGDKPYPSVALALDDQHHTKTNASGHYEYKRVKEGEHTLTFDPSGIKMTEPVTMQKKVTFTTTGEQERYVPFPIQPQRATIIVRSMLDVNNNNTADFEDEPVNIKRSTLFPPTGEPRVLHARGTMGLIIPGIEKGRAEVEIDTSETPDNIELIGSPRQRVHITEDQDYVITYLFRPLRIVQGALRYNDPTISPRGIRVALGSASSQVDAEGYYYIEKLKPGSYTLQVSGMRSGYCIAQPSKKEVRISNNAAILSIAIVLKKQCAP